MTVRVAATQVANCSTAVMPVLCLCPYCIVGVNCVIYVFLQYFDTVAWVF